MRVRGALAALVLAGWLAGPASAQVRSVEAVGAVPGGPQAPKGLPIQQAAIEAGLREAVRRVALEILAGGAADAEPRLDGALGPNVYEYVSRFQLLEDRGEQRPLLLHDPELTSEYVVLVSVQVDDGRLRDRLTRAGLLAPDGAPAAGRVLLVLEDLRSWRPVEAVTQRLRADPGVRSVVPEEFSPGRARLALETTQSADAIVKRLLAQPPEGIQLVPVRQDPEGVWLRASDAAIDTPEPNRY